jgi:hypothetical protein
MNSPNTKYFFFLTGAGEPTERFDTDDYGKAKKAIVDFVRTHKDRKGTLYTKDEGGSEWYDYAGWHFD